MIKIPLIDIRIFFFEGVAHSFLSLEGYIWFLSFFNMTSKQVPNSFTAVILDFIILSETNPQTLPSSRSTQASRSFL